VLAHAARNDMRAGQPGSGAAHAASAAELAQGIADARTRALALIAAIEAGVSAPASTVEAWIGGVLAAVEAIDEHKASSKIEAWSRLAAVVGTQGRREVAASALASARARIAAMPDRAARRGAWQSLSKAALEAGLPRDALDLWRAVIATSADDGYEATLLAISEGAVILLNANEGDALWQVYKQVEDLHTWWDA
jgi:hypothetical protein